METLNDYHKRWGKEIKPYKSHNQTQPVKISLFSLEEKISIAVTVGLIGAVMFCQSCISKTNDEYKLKDNYNYNYGVRK